MRSPLINFTPPSLDIPTHQDDIRSIFSPPPLNKLLMDERERERESLFNALVCEAEIFSLAATFVTP